MKTPIRFTIDLQQLCETLKTKFLKQISDIVELVEIKF